jgi:hypothetical protein
MQVSDNQSETQGSTVMPDRAESRALIVLAPAPGQRATGSHYHRHASFLAHLLAAKQQCPQTRGRRRAGVEEAFAAYRAAASLT